MITIADIDAAHERISPFVRRTPIMEATLAREDLPVDASVTLKLELNQVTGSFKARGAMNRLLGADRAEIANGIITASGGNHGLAVARTAHVAGVPAFVYVPETVSPAKVEKMHKWGAEVRVVGAEWSASNEAALEFARSSGAAYFHPFADPLVVAGQGTLGLEILDQIEDFDTIVIAIGGGGLIAGLSTSIKAHRPNVRIVAVEPVGSPTIKASLDAGAVVTLPEVTSRVATMSCRRTDERVFEIARRLVSDVVLVSDEAMLSASQWLWYEYGIAADLSGAASIAALRSGHRVFDESRRICALICGAGAEGTAP
ncbi:threonine/serine dehydratase [Pseudaminobacter sp. 19-2017]|uniref:Threonine/serine dehydratase n=1 Tax=Pseudaminobacter soli (ex Zhang et al. 2022) TaxID=2831468 RepID=A0A942DV09_9HYPH|nr:threonine/serine dehydratase [Pseudaminobacter soli]MBS3647234.1 threonine/serine dehydratase [Pseudaminobacter soli]